MPCTTNGNMRQYEAGRTIAAQKKRPRKRGAVDHYIKKRLSFRAFPILTALIAFLPGTVLLGAMGAILFLMLGAAGICHRSGQHYGRYSQ